MAEKRLVSGWEGRYYEDFAIGEVYRSRFGRTVTELDNSMFTHLTMNTNPLHFDAPSAVVQVGEQRLHTIVASSRHA